MNNISLGKKIAAYTFQGFLIIIIFLPLVFAFTSSLRPLDEIYKYLRPLSLETFIPIDFTIGAYISIFTEFGFGTAIINSLFVAAVTIVFGIMINALAGFSFAKFDFKCKNLLFFIVMVTFMIPFELMSINLYKLMIDFNWINSFWALIIPSVSNGMVIFMFRQYFLGFPKYMIESAMMDGMTWPRILMHIVFPNTKPICISAGLILFITQWESFLWPVLVTRTPQMHTIQIALSSFQTEHAKIWNNIFAASIIAFIIPILIILPLQRYFVAGITNVGVKG